MPQNTQTQEKMVDCYMSAKEYYQFRILAIERKACFHVKWKVDQALVTTTAAFLVALGFNPGIDF